jgi:hypothetical protein
LKDFVASSAVATGSFRLPNRKVDYGAKKTEAAHESRSFVGQQEESVHGGLPNVEYSAPDSFETDNLVIER